MTYPADSYRRTIEGHEYEWREGPRGLGWYNDANQWFLTAQDADRRSQPGAVASDENTMGMLAHLLVIFTGFLGPLVIYLVKSDATRARANAAEALNFSITVMIAFVVSFVLAFVLIGVLLLPLVGVAAIVFPILGAVAANQGNVYRYPLTIRFVGG